MWRMTDHEIGAGVDEQSAEGNVALRRRVSPIWTPVCRDKHKIGVRLCPTDDLQEPLSAGGFGADGQIENTVLHQAGFPARLVVS